MPRVGTRRKWRSAARSLPEVQRAARRLGKRVRLLRERSDFTQEDLADRGHLDSKHVQDIEAGNSNVTLATLVGLAKALDTTIEKLMSGM